ncbi:MAG: ATP-dependent helicase [Bacteroidia bacterium]
MQYLQELNEVQKEAVLNTEGPVMVIAGAGSGKTRVLTYRIAHLIEKGIDPFNILALTFTNKAAREMKERIAKIVGESEAKNIWMGTFHSIFARILRFEAEKLGYPNNFTIYDTDDAKNLIKTIIKEFGLDDKTYKPSTVYNRISSAKNNLISATAYINNTDIMADDRSAGKPRIGDIYMAYQNRLKKSGAMDFDDLLFNTNILFRDFADVLLKYQHKFRYILVDEYQDTNYSQYLIVKRLAAVHENICVVGDDAQSIYAFRGANIQNILNFKKDYPDVKLFKLEQNYRSTQTIVEAANSVIWKNKDQIKKVVWTDNGKGEKIKVLRALTDNEEGLIVARNINDLHLNHQASYKDFAILYRTNAQSRSMEEALRKLNIPYKIYGGLSFYQRKEIKDLIAYFRLTINPKDEEALKRIINYPARGIGQTSIDKIILAANEQNKSLWEIVEMIDFTVPSIASSTRIKINEFVTMIKSFHSGLNNEGAYELAHRIASHSGILKELYADKTPEGVSRYENIEELLNGIKEFAETPNADGTVPTLTEFIQDIALLTDNDTKDDENNNDHVSLMTIHSAKGLEFPYVFIVGLEENLFPSQMSLYSREELEEERRLFYVALTRAKKQAFLAYAVSRYRWGNLTHSEPSRFIDEIDATHLEMPISVTPLKNENFERNTWNTIDKSELDSFSTFNKPKKLIKIDHQNQTTKPSPGNGNIIRLEVGNRVQHERFGKGTVIALEGNFPDQKATVNFEGVGNKQLLLKFAKLTLI